MNEHEQTKSKASFIEKISKSITSSTSSKTVFGDPVEHEGVKIVPVAKIRYGFGGGYGHKKMNSTGKGGGGGAIAQPVGYIEIKNGQTTFKAIPDIASLSSKIILAGIIGFLSLKKSR